MHGSCMPLRVVVVVLLFAIVIALWLNLCFVFEVEVYVVREGRLGGCAWIALVVLPTHVFPK